MPEQETAPVEAPATEVATAPTEVAEPTAEETKSEPAAKVASDATINEKSSEEAVDMTLPGGEKLLAALSYVGFFCVLSMLAKPESELCKHHGKQGMAVALIFFIASTALLTVTLLIGTSAMLYKLTAVAFIAWAAFSVMGMMAASAGKKASLPFFGGIAKKLEW